MINNENKEVIYKQKNTWQNLYLRQVKMQAASIKLETKAATFFRAQIFCISGRQLSVLSFPHWGEDVWRKWNWCTKVKIKHFFSNVWI